MAQPSDGARRDPFLRVDLNENPKYRRILSTKLEVTPFDCGRFVVRPAFDPECSVSVYSYAREGGTRGYRMTYVLASDNIWQASDGGRYLRKAAAVKIQRFDAELQKETAELLQSVWLRLLRGVHPSASETPQDWILIDPPVFEWSLQRLNGPPLRVQANLYIKGILMQKLFADLSDITLRSYCMAEPTKRPAIAREIAKQAKALLKLSGK